MPDSRDRLRDGWPMYYILVGKMPVAVDMMTWAEWFVDHKKRIVAKTEIGDRCGVSTIFLGLDHSFGRGDPILFETMIFGGPLDGYQWRYSTWEQAERGHAEAVVEARKACAQVGALLTNALRHRPSKGWRKHIRNQKAQERR
jgi:hypothetical protein